MDEVFRSSGISWNHCVGTGVDDTSVNICIRNSIRTGVLRKNSAIYFMGCPCHIVHNTASAHVIMIEDELFLIHNRLPNLTLKRC